MNASCIAPQTRSTRLTFARCVVPSQPERFMSTRSSPSVHVADLEIELAYLERPVRLFKRPLLDDFLQEASKLAELVIFSAAVEGYVREAVSMLDPGGHLFAGRVLTRTHCTPVDAMLAKDLSLLGRPLERLVLVDDNVASCMLQPDNCVPIRPFFGDREDRELGSLLPLLRRLRDEPDVRSHLRDTFQLQAKLLGGVRGMRDQDHRHL